MAFLSCSRCSSEEDSSSYSQWWERISSSFYFLHLNHPHKMFRKHEETVDSCSKEFTQCHSWKTNGYILRTACSLSKMWVHQSFKFYYVKVKEMGISPIWVFHWHGVFHWHTMSFLLCCFSIIYINFVLLVGSYWKLPLWKFSCSFSPMNTT